MYNHQEIEKKWANFWEKNESFKTKEDLDKPKYYILDMFPYPSGAGLHVGHPKGYIATDIFAKYKILKGFNVLHPMGWDAFGLPAENYAIKNKLHPRQTTEDNIKTFKRQLSLLGLGYDWDREINTTDPKYYKWTQWIFLQMFKKGLAYESYEPINWCPSCQTGLANEDLEDGVCERCGSAVEQKPMRQWVLKITDYADRLVDGLDSLKDWDKSIKDMQRNWIGRSYGTEVIFKVKDSQEEIKVFTTRVDTIFGCSYLVLAPENKLVQELKDKISNFSEVDKYLKLSKNKTELQRTDLNKDKTGIILEGLLAINPFNKKELKVFIADYVLNSYGTGAVMAVPAHDERDFEFAEKYGLDITTSVARKGADGRLLAGEKSCFTEDGFLVDSGDFSALSSLEARKKMTKWLEKNNLGKGCVNYKINDWVFSRQRYWGEPIPLIHCEKCGVVPVPEAELPLKLPEVANYQPSGTGESPLALIHDWVNTTCPKCGGKAKRETNTMPQWGGSCWYYLRYIDPRNDSFLVDKKKEKYWSPVDFYVGGAEHATRHLIYARFWHKFLFDIGVVSYDEPFVKLKNVGLIIGEDGRKMSKRWGNVINPDELVEKYGADSLRVYEMFMGPFSQSSSWSTNGLIGARKFLDKVELLFSEIGEVEEESEKVLSLLHKTIKKVGHDIESFDFNTAISALMIFVNECSSFKQKNKKMPLKVDSLKLFVKIIFPFAPFLAEELWQRLGEEDSIFNSTWPIFSADLAKDKQINLAVQINGKLRATIEVEADILETEAFVVALENEKVRTHIEGKEIVKKIFVPGRLVNLVIK